VIRGSNADPSALAVERFRAPDDVRPGGTVRVNVTLRNVGSVPFEGQVAYRLDGVVVATDWIRVPVGERRAVRFRVSYAVVDRAAVPLSSRDTTHGVWIGNESLRERPVTVRAPTTTPTATTPTPTATFAPTATPTATPTVAPTGTAVNESAAAEPCRRGFFTPCGGSPLDQAMLTLIGTVASMLGIIYELLQGR
jgi:hypothetical protein